ncbi:MAG TPA: hypothetical protein VFC35_07850, partial [Gemmatimonadaceae bacterium]|nr:hypothetical protein [Gemmatimonadaceae bacterium]
MYTTLEGTDASLRTARNRPTSSFVALRDTNNDGRADIIKRIGTIGNTGIGIHNAHLYVDEGRRIVRYPRA